MMTHIGFHSHLVTLVMSCITSISYSIMINGEAQGHILPTRGLCQGDPLLSYLFLICAEGLSSMLIAAELANEIHGMSISQRGPPVTHLFFADDSLIFCHASALECRKVLNILQDYEDISGQKMNTDKTTMCLNCNTNPRVQEVLKTIIGVLAIRSYERYLGLSSFIGH